MLEVNDLPDVAILERFAERYGQMDIESVLAFLKVLKVGTDLSNALNHYLAGFDVMQGRWWVLILLMRQADKKARPSLLAEQAGVSRATMSGLLENLSRQGLIRRETVAHDKRHVIVCLTDAGQRKLDAIMPGYYQRVNQLMGALDKPQTRQMLSALGTLQHNRDVFLTEPKEEYLDEKN